MEHQYTKNPDVQQAFVPGYGRVRDGAVLIGEQWAKFATPAGGKLLVPFTPPAPSIVRVIPALSPPAKKTEPDLAASSTPSATPVPPQEDPVTQTREEEKAAGDAEAQGAKEQQVEKQEEQQEEQQAEESALTADSLMGMTGKDLKAVADAAKIEIPAEVRLVGELRAYLLKVMFDVEES